MKYLFIILLLPVFAHAQQRFSDSSVIIQMVDSLPKDNSMLVSRSKAINWHFVKYETVDGTVKRITGGSKSRGDATGIYSVWQARIDSTMKSKGRDTTFIRTKRELVKVILKKQTDKMKPKEVNEFTPKTKK